MHVSRKKKTKYEIFCIPVLVISFQKCTLVTIASPWLTFFSHNNNKKSFLLLLVHYEKHFQQFCFVLVFFSIHFFYVSFIFVHFNKHRESHRRFRKTKNPLPTSQLTTSKRKIAKKY